VPSVCNINLRLLLVTTSARMCSNTRSQQEINLVVCNFDRIATPMFKCCVLSSLMCRLPAWSTTPVNRRGSIMCACSLGQTLPGVAMLDETVHTTILATLSIPHTCTYYSIDSLIVIRVQYSHDDVKIVFKLHHSCITLQKLKLLF